MTTMPQLTTTCPACERTFTLHGPVNLEQLNADWFFCPWCAKALELRPIDTQFTNTQPQPQPQPQPGKEPTNVEPK